jgi:predicted acetyltransferase
MGEEFQFLDPGALRDGELSVVLGGKNPADAVKGWVPSYDFHLHIDGVTRRIGRVNFRAGNTQSLKMFGGHFGYGIDPAHRGHHYAERAVRLLLPLARQHGLETVWITCNPDNWPSRRTCERLGATLVEIEKLPPDNDMYLEGMREKCRYRIEL